MERDIATILSYCTLIVVACRLVANHCVESDTTQDYNTIFHMHTTLTTFVFPFFM